MLIMDKMATEAGNSTKSREEWIDSFRGLGAVLVVIGHSSSRYHVVKLIYAFHMPLFFILSGYLFNYARWKDLGVKKLVLSKSKAYLIPFYIMTVVNLFICFAIFRIFYNVDNNYLMGFFKTKIYGMIFGGYSAQDTPNCTPLWFLLCVFIANLLLFAILNLPKIIYQIIACIICVCTEMTLIFLGWSHLPWHIGRALIGVVFMYAGFCIRKLKLLDKVGWPAVLIMLIAGVISAALNAIVDINAGMYGNIILFFCASILITYAFLWFFYKYKLSVHFLSMIGRSSIIIMGYNYAIRDLFVRFNASYYINLVGVLVICCLINYVCCQTKRLFQCILN